MITRLFYFVDIQVSKARRSCHGIHKCGAIQKVSLEYYCDKIRPPESSTVSARIFSSNQMHPSLLHSLTAKNHWKETVQFLPYHSATFILPNKSLRT